MTEHNYTFDVTLSNFNQQVIEASFETPVLLEFYMENYEPCKVLAPLLDSVVESYQGTLLLGRVNCETEQGVAMQFGIRGLPTVVLFKEGQPIDGFAGEQSEASIRDMLTKHIAEPLALDDDDNVFERASVLYQQGDKAAAEALLKALLSEDNTQMEALILYARCLAERGEYGEAETILSSVVGDDHKHALAAAKAQLTFLKQAEALPSLDVLQAQFAQNPESDEVLYQLAIALLADQQYEDAMEGLLNLFKRNRTYQDDLPRKTLLQLFDVLGNADPLVTKYRKKLYQLLY